MVFWAGNFIVVKGAVEILPPIGFSFLRYCIAAVTLLILLRWREGAIRLPRGDVVPILLLGVIGFGCYQILWPIALQTIPAGDSALLIATTPVMTALLAMAVGADTPNAVKLIGAFVSFAGVALVIAAGQGLDLGTSLVGDVLTLVAAACWAVYTVFGARILRRHSPLMTTTWAILAGTIFMAPLGIAQLATSELSGGLPELGLPDRPCAPLFRDARRGVRQRHRVPRREAARTDPGHRPPVPGPGPGGGDGGDLPRRTDPPGPGRRRRRHPGRRRAPAARLVAERAARGAGDRRHGAVTGAGRRRRHPSRRCSPGSRRWPSSSTTTGRSR